MESAYSGFFVDDERLRQTASSGIPGEQPVGSGKKVRKGVLSTFALKGRIDETEVALKLQIS